MTPLVLVHGFMGGSAQWRRQVEVLGGGRDVIAVDLPGFGRNRDQEAPNTIAGFAAFVFEELDRRGVGSFHLLGHSMGGMIVQEMTAMAPHRIERLMLYGTAAAGNLPGRFETFEESKRRVDADGVRATARRISATWFLAGEADRGYEDCAAVAELSSRQALVAGLNAMRSWSRVDDLPAIPCPTLIVWGEADRTYGWPQIEQLWRNVPRASLAVVPGCAHAVHLEKPEIFNALLADFLRIE